MVVRVSNSGTVATTGGGLRERLIAYKDLGKLEFVDVYFGVPLAWTLLAGTHAAQARTFGLLALMLVFNVALVAATEALDDVQGIRDGSDSVNYDESATLRKRKRKPLLDERLTERQALRFAWTCGLAAIVAGAGAFVLAGAEPWWFAPLAAALMVLVLNYSWGLKLSYHGGQELVVIVGGALNLCLMYAVVDGGLTWAVVVEGLLLGLWLMHVAEFANLNDREGDRQARRMTFTARLSIDGAYRFTVGLHALGWVVLAVGLGSGALPWWFLPLQLPCLAMQLVALRLAIVRGNWLAARLASIRVYRLGWLGLIVSNLILVW
jgi:1,4-dihydroxy-2-naphthoate octaprenyltransferase